MVDHLYEAEVKARRKIRTSEGVVGMVMKDFSNGYCTVQLHKGYYYPLLKTEGLRDVTEEEFKREFR